MTPADTRPSQLRASLFSQADDCVLNVQTLSITHWTSLDVFKTAIKLAAVEQRLPSRLEENNLDHIGVTLLAWSVRWFNN